MSDSSMSVKRPAESSLDTDGNRRSSKRLKPSPAASPITQGPSLLQRRVAGVRDLIPKIPSNRITKGLETALSTVIDETIMARPDTYKIILRAVDEQIAALANPEAEDAILTKFMIENLNAIKELLLATHEPKTSPKPMPVPSAFAFGKYWEEAQEGPDAILCLRPAKRQGLPLTTLHEAFRFFVNESKKPLAATDADALSAACRLSSAMAKSYDDEEPKRRDAFNTALDPFISKESWLPEFGLGEMPGMTGWLDGGLIDFSTLREDKAEPGSQGDAYMKIARGFQAFVMWKQSQNSDHGKAGVAKFLFILSGPFLMIAGGFYDGKCTIVEPLTPSIPMLPDHDIEGRPMVLAQCLRAFKKAVSLIRVPPERTVVAETPCIYSSVLASDGTEIPISFVEPIPGSLIFLATATIEIHRLLARDGLAPRLLGVRVKEGAPIAIAMEYLKPHSLGSEGWVKLFSFAEETTAPEVQKALVIAVHEIVGKLEQANLVHGDLRANNLMVHVNADGTVLDGDKVRVKVIDFDWSGQSGATTYPLWRNSKILWPGKIGEAVVVGHDKALVKSWWGEMFQQAYPPVG